MRVFNGCRVKYVGDLSTLQGKRGTVMGKSLILPHNWKVQFRSKEKNGDIFQSFQHLARWEFVVTSRKYKPVK